MKYTFTANTDTYNAKPDSQATGKITRNLEPVFIESIEDFIEDVQQGIS